MTTWLINYATLNFRREQWWNSRTGAAIAGFDKVISYGPRDLEDEFRRENHFILSQTLGGGCWLWKPWIIARTLQLMAVGDFLLYADASFFFLSSVNPLIEFFRAHDMSLMQFGIGYKFKEKYWTKRDALILMDADTPGYTETMQRMTGIIPLKKDDFSMHFVQEWLRYSQDCRIITRMKNQQGLDNYPGFQEHRDEQSIFSILGKKYSLPAVAPVYWPNTMLQQQFSVETEKYYEEFNKRYEPYDNEDQTDLLWPEYQRYSFMMVLYRRWFGPRFFANLRRGDPFKCPFWKHFLTSVWRVVRNYPGGFQHRI